ncbi:precorrin-3B synthase [Microvirga zambiensis]|uniref:precorrin-3B synthase n=1 Tax=Microvirga zambiensis TaxID=1402137 RepID=UPI00191FB0EA|nr:precorrin-3B synthase [Microvirga zambiensis]
MSALSIPNRRRGWCPGVRRPMETGDGLLVRLHPFGGRLTANQARLIAEAAGKFGNGHLDVTARGNLQIRGVNDEIYPALLALLESEGLAEPEGDGPNRLTAVSPLAGLDPHDRFDALVLAEAIESETVSVDGLPAKFFVAVDGGGSMPLDAIGADLHLAAEGGDTVAFSTASADGPRNIGTCSLKRAPAAATSIVSGFARMRREGRTEAGRLRDLAPELVREIVEQAGLEPPAVPPQRPVPQRAGVFQTRSGKAVLLALTFGRCSSDQLEQAAHWSKRFGNGEIHFSFTRGILLPGIADRDASTLIAEASRAGFITEASDSRLSFLACPGKPDCANALVAAPADASRLAGTCGDLLPQGTTVHVSGCPKGCAHPGRADLTLVGRADGRYDIVPNGTARDVSSLHLSIDEIMNRLLPNAAELRRAFPERMR